MSIMVEMDINDVVERLRELHAFNPRLAQRSRLEPNLPEDPALFFASSIEHVLARCDGADPDVTGEAFGELEQLLTRSYAYYVERLVEAGMPWTFRFHGESRPGMHFPVYTQQ